jgi:hypothetical protein
MPSFLSPLWLLALLGVPLLRWLHRFSRQERGHPVAALFLWRQAATETQGRRRGPPDPRWRLRALLLAVLALALARPVLEQDDPRGIEVWIDDSPSMQTLETGGSRLRLALERLDRELAGRDATDVMLRSLQDPALRLEWRGSARSGWQDQGREAEPQDATDARPPPAVSMTADREHWLVTDGADAAINAWARQAPLHRVLRTGSVRDNVALTRLAVRPALQDNAAHVLLRVHNPGEQMATRQLVLYANDRELHRESLDLPPDQARELSLRLPDLHAGALLARLEPADALAWDDQLGVAHAALDPVRVDLDASCPRALHTVLRNHPRLVLRPGATDALPIRCGQAYSGPGLFFKLPTQPVPLDYTPGFAPPWPWLDRDWLHTDRSSPIGADEEILLGNRAQPLVSLQAAASRRVTVHFDIARDRLIRQPEYPLLVDALLGTVLQRALLDETFVASRPVMESRIAPRPVARGELPTSQADSRRARALQPYALWLALLLLALDLLGAARSGRTAGLR